MKFGLLYTNINMVKVKTYLPFVVFVVVLLTNILILVFVLPNKIFQIIDIKNQVDIISVEAKQLGLANEKLAAVDIGQLSTAAEIAGVGLPDEKKVAGLITGLGTVASSSGVVVKSISFSPGRVSTASAETNVVSSGEVEIGASVRAIAVTMTVNSSLGQFLDYLKKLQVASQLLGVTGMSYLLSGTTPGGEVNLLVYYLPARIGKPSWLSVPTIDPSDLEVLAKLSRSDIFTLPSGSR